MTRIARTLFGSFGERQSTAVVADNWWFFCASDVELDAESRAEHDLAAILPESAAKTRSAVPERIDVEWFRSVAPIGLQLQPRLIMESPLLLGLVACRVQDDRIIDGPVVDLAYPFLLLEQESRLRLQFSSMGPAAEIQREIIVAFGQRLLGPPTIRRNAAG